MMALQEPGQGDFPNLVFNGGSQSKVRRCIAHGERHPENPPFPVPSILRALTRFLAATVVV